MSTQLTIAARHSSTGETIPLSAAMLKWFGPSNGPASQSRSKYVGKTYHVGDHRVTVEEVIAEGE